MTDAHTLQQEALAEMERRRRAEDGRWPRSVPNEPDDGSDLVDLLDPSWEPIDLGPALRGEKVPPEAHVFVRDDGMALMPPGINWLHGDSGDGKSMVALLATLTEINEGHAVIWVSYEDPNEDTVVGRIRQLGAHPELAQRLVRFIAPQETFIAGATHLADLALSSGARLLVLDSVGEALNLAGLNEDRDAEVGPWIRKSLRAVSDQVPGLAVLPIDHGTKAKDSPLFPSGSKRKRAAITARGYMLNVRSPFAVGHVGYVQLLVSKDRTGLLRRGTVAAEIKLDATTEPYTFDVKAPADGDTPAGIGRRKAEERVREVLGESSVPVTAEEITRIANGPDRRRQGEAGLAIKTVKNALTHLAKSPEVVQIVRPEQSGVTSPTAWSLTRPEDVPE